MGYKFSSLPLIFLLFITFGCANLSKTFDSTKPESQKARLSWVKNLDPSYDTGNLPIAFQSPLIHDGLVFVGKDGEGMRAYQLNNGRLVWKVKDKGDYHAGIRVFEDLLIYGTNEGRVYARNYLTGEQEYAIDLDAPIESRPTFAKGVAYFHLRNHKVFALDAKTGEILWAYKRSVPYLTTIQRASLPLVHDGKVFVGFADGSVVAINAEDGVLLWESRLVSGSKFIDVDVAPMIYRGKLLVNSLAGELNILDPQTGNILRRVSITPARKPLELAEGLVVGTVDGKVHLLNSQFEIVSSIDLGRKAVTGVLPWKEGYIVTLAAKKIFWVDASLKQRETLFHLGHESSAVFGDSALSQGKAAILSSRNRLYLFN